ncbi:MAG TPA: 50S ribosomal protein L24 [Candidatus Woesebacteria bacterium]|nr:50S ribosomal protein L24 [Candidatus Woesebacteria bacterium]HNS94684.1 50S ribosomal protein L24 [Candidatus Woesebacteria bacterium]
MKIRKGDTVLVIAGKDVGKKGKVESVNDKNQTVRVPDVNMYKRHVRKSEQFPQGGIIDIARALHVSKVALVCPVCGKQTRIGFEMTKDHKQRICRKCKKVIT